MVRVPWAIVSVIPRILRAFKMRFEQVFNNPTFKRMDAFEGNNPVSRGLCFGLLFLDTCNVKQILTMIIRINYFRSLLWFALISMRGMTLYNSLLPPSSSFFALQVIWWSLVSATTYFKSLKSHNSMNCEPIYKILVPKIISKS